MKILKENIDYSITLKEGDQRLQLDMGRRFVAFYHEKFIPCKAGYWGTICHLHLHYENRADFINKLYDWCDSDEVRFHYLHGDTPSIDMDEYKLSLWYAEGYRHMLSLKFIPNLKQRLRVELERLFEPENINYKPVRGTNDVYLFKDGRLSLRVPQDEEAEAIYRPKDGRLIEIWRFREG